jgi:hypothetical protein
MATVVNKYRVYCNTEAAYVYVWAETEPTVCPNNNGHSIDTGKTTIDATIEENTVEVKEENTPTGGHYRSCCQAFTANVGSNTHDFSYPYPISLLSATFNSGPVTEGDTLSMDVGPGTTIGVITSNVAAEATIISVSSTVIDNIAIGRCAHLDDGTNSERHAVTAINTASSQITIDTGATYAYNVATPTYVKMSVCMANSLEIIPNCRYVLGDSKIGGSYIPANTTIRIIYNNTGESAVRVRPIFEFLY